MKGERIVGQALVLASRLPFVLAGVPEKRDSVLWRLPLYRVLRETFSLADEDYNAVWGGADYQGTTVLDLGADWGSTALFFLSRGAKRVVAVEANRSRYKRLATLSPRHNIRPLRLRISTGAQIDMLVKAFKPDIVKVDIEGGEAEIRNVEASTLRYSPTWLVEVHSAEIKEKVCAKFKESGFNVQKIRNIAPGVDVIHASLRTTNDGSADGQRSAAGATRSPLRSAV